MDENPNAREPFGLPPGTVRGLLALIALLGSSAAVLLERGVPEWYIAIVGMAAGSYFAIRPGKEG